MPEDIQKKVANLETITQDKQGMTVNFAINYGGRDEIVRALKQLTKDCIDGKVDWHLIDEERLGSYLDTKEMPDPDLMIRTSGELRTSNFLPWQLAYSEFYFTTRLWPDFTKEAFDEALDEYARRKRRFGKSE